MSSIHDAIGSRVIELLEQILIVENPYDVAVPKLIRMGQLQESPTAQRISVLVNPGDLDDVGTDPKWADTHPNKEEGWSLPSYEIGGGEFWWRRFTLDINVYLQTTQEDRSEARAIGTDLMGRITQLFSQNRDLGGGIVSDFGEVAIYATLNKAVVLESGGPPRSFIYRNKIFFSVLTEVP